MAAEAQGCSSATGYKSIRRFLAEGLSGLADRSSRPHRSPERLSPRREAAILSRREETLEGPHRIGWALGEAPSTVHRVLRRLGAPRLWIWIDPAAPSCATSESVPVSSSTSTSRSRARSPPVAVAGPRTSGHARPSPGRGYDFIHAAIDDRSRLAYAEILPDERKETASAFMSTRDRVLRRARHRHRAGAHRQRLVLPLQGVRCARWPMPASPTDGPAPTAPRPTARSNGST